jgi:acyl-[acyl carrier protein]--UDP-N-acetylglucosamine O-acyltransferase
MRPTGIHPTAEIGNPPEHRDWHEGDPYTRPAIDPTARINAFCTVDGGMPRKTQGDLQERLLPTYIGPRTFCMARCHVAHNVQIGADCELGAGVVVCGEVVIGDRVRIGGNAWIRPMIKIGDDARIGGGAVVVKDVPAGEVWAGNPAKPLKTGREAKARGQLRGVGDAPTIGESDHDTHFHFPVSA